jgi:predicted lysophospholipase L1 biosynthesis ABC-type transport system permease subunit
MALPASRGPHLLRRRAAHRYCDSHLSILALILLELLLLTRDSAALCHAIPPDSPNILAVNIRKSIDSVGQELAPAREHGTSKLVPYGRNLPPFILDREHV